MIILKKIFNNKRAIELSVNFMVWLILALVVFGMGLMLFKKFFSEATDIKQNLDDQTKKELMAIMTSSPEQVVIYPTQFTVKKGRGGVFGVGILNTGGSDNFEISSDFDTGGGSGPMCYDSDGSDLGCSAGDINVINSMNRSVELNKREIIDVPVRAMENIKSGKYAVKVIVRHDGSDISTNLVYINVP